jgi:reverse transcriptase-like protein
MDHSSTTSLESVKKKMCEAPILSHPDFTKPFAVEFDTSGKGIGVVLILEGRLITYFSEKHSE